MSTDEWTQAMGKSLTLAECNPLYLLMNIKHIFGQFDPSCDQTDLQDTMDRYL